MRKNLYNLFLLVLLSVCPVFATTFVVNNNGDTVDAIPGDGVCSDSLGNCTLRAAVQEANRTSDPDTISFVLPLPTIIMLSLGEIEISSSLTMTGQGATELVVRRSSSATTNFGIFNINNGQSVATVSINGITIANGTDSGIRSSAAILNLARVIVRNNDGIFGGGIRSTGALNVVDSTIRNNIASSPSGTGGGIWIGAEHQRNN